MIRRTSKRLGRGSAGGWPNTAPIDHRRRRVGLLALVSVDFCGAFNDNLYKMIVSFLAVGTALSAGAGGTYLSLTGAVFILPYLLFSGYAGYLADRFDKQSVLVATKTVEIAVMGLAFAALVLRRFDLLLVALFLTASTAAFASPAKYAILPEMLPASELSRANGMLQMSRYLAIVLGSGAGGAVSSLWSDQPAYIGATLIALACAGAAASLWVISTARPRVRPRFAPNPFAGVVAGIRRLVCDPVLGPAVAGLALVDTICALVMMDMILVSKETLQIDDLRMGGMAAFAGLGIGAGSVVCGRLSKDRILPGLACIGGGGGAVALFILYLSCGTYPQATAALGLVGFAGGFIFVPLNSLVQHIAWPGEKGSVIATSNFLSMAGVLAASALLWLLRDVFDLSPDQIILASALLMSLAVIVLGPRWRSTSDVLTD